MAVTFLEPGGDATFNIQPTTAGGFWSSASAFIVNDIVHGAHQRSLKSQSKFYGSVSLTPASVVSDAGGRMSAYIYIVAYPPSQGTCMVVANVGGGTCFGIGVSTAGQLQLVNSALVTLGSPGSTLSLNTWYRISVAYTVSSTTVNTINVFKDGVSDITATNVTISATSTTKAGFGDTCGTVGSSLRLSDMYVDNSGALTDPGDIWVTAKRPNANGTTNNFATRIGSGGSGYGTGHSPQVNEQPLSNSNGWSVVAVGATTEEYNIESIEGNIITGNLLKEDGFNLLQENGNLINLDLSTTNIDISTATLVDYVGWVDCKAVLAETGQIIVNNVTSNISIPANTETMFTAFAGSTTYPSGTGADIGMITSATATTVSLYECGIIFAYIPASAPPATVSPIQEFMLLGVGT